MFTFMILLSQIVTEKERKLRMGMQMMGLKDSMFWLSWLAYAAVIQALSICIMFASGAAFGFGRDHLPTYSRYMLQKEIYISSTISWNTFLYLR
jgi:hypothetical protein